MEAQDVPVGLRRWFVVHFAVDLLVAVPLFIAPRAERDLLFHRRKKPAPYRPREINLPHAYFALAGPQTTDGVFDRIAKNTIAQPERYKRDHRKSTPFEPTPNHQPQHRDNKRHSPKRRARSDRHEPVEHRARPLVIDEKKELLFHPVLADVRSLWPALFL